MGTEFLRVNKDDEVTKKLLQDGHVQIKRNAGGTAKTALGLSIGALAPVVIDAGARLYKHMTSDNFKNAKGVNAMYETKENAELRSQLAAKDSVIAAQASDSRTDAKIAAVFERLYQISAAGDAKIAGLQKEFGQELVDIRVNDATTQGNIKCLAQNTNARFEALAAETTEAIKLVDYKSECRTNSLREYINGHFVKGVLKINKNDICPPVE